MPDRAGVQLAASDVKHLRRLLGWVRCEAGQTPEEFLATINQVAVALGHPEISTPAQERLLHSYYRAESIPKYVHAALKALDRVLASTGDGGQEVHYDHLQDPGLPPPSVQLIKSSSAT